MGSNLETLFFTFNHHSSGDETYPMLYARKIVRSGANMTLNVDLNAALNANLNADFNVKITE